MDEGIDPVSGLPYLVLPEDYFRVVKDFKERMAVGRDEWDWEEIGTLCGLPIFKMKVWEEETE